MVIGSSSKVSDFKVVERGHKAKGKSCRNRSLLKQSLAQAQKKLKLSASRQHFTQTLSLLLKTWFIFVKEYIFSPPKPSSPCRYSPCLEDYPE